jgi:NADH:ubiquinone oxidoreductase subunit 3 (subunit A)
MYKSRLVVFDVQVCFLSLIHTMMNNIGENTREDKVKIIITFTIIILISIGILLVAFGFFDAKY